MVPSHTEVPEWIVSASLAGPNLTLFDVKISDATFLTFRKKVPFFSDLLILSCIFKKFSCASDPFNNFRTLFMISNLPKFNMMNTYCFPQPSGPATINGCFESLDISHGEKWSMYLFTSGVNITANFVDEKSPICKLSGTLH